MNPPRDNSGQPLPLPITQRIDDVCARFEAVWQAGATPRLEDFLGAANGAERDELLRQLLCVDLKHHQRRGTALTVADYLPRFPDHETLIREEVERSSGQADRSRGSPGTAQGETLETCRPALTPCTDVGETLTPTAQQQPFTTACHAIPGYQILDELGRGGMGVVYKARQVRLNRVVALKMILTGRSARPEELARFRAEAEAVARLQHPNVVQVFDIDESQGQLFCALEYVEGGSLKDRLRKGPLPIRVAARLVEVLARAVQAAHERGVVHRDLKPGNILLAVDGTPKVSDFGLAKFLDAEAGPTSAPQKLTAPGAVVGTPAYMAPEQAEGESGPGVDVYALGAILYELLTGEVPFSGKTALDTLLLVRSQPVLPPRARRGETPVPLEAICLRCLEKEPGRRYPSAGDLADALRDFLEGDGAASTASFAPPTPVAPPRQQRRPGYAVAFGIVLGCLLVGAWAWWQVRVSRPDDPAPAPPREALSGELTVWVWSQERGRQLRIAPDPHGGALPVREADRLSIEVKLNQPAHAYLLWIDPAGAVIPLYPWNDPTGAGDLEIKSVAGPPPQGGAVQSVVNPSRPGVGYQTDDTTGLDTILLLVRRTPWPADRDLSRLIGSLPEARNANDDELIVRAWAEDGRELAEPQFRLDRSRGVKAGVVDDQLAQVVARLRNDFDFIRAVRFAHAKKNTDPIPQP